MKRRGGQRQIAFVVAAAAVYELARRLIHPSWPLALRHAHDVLTLERHLGLAWEVLLQHALSPVATPLALLYLGAQFVVTAVFFLWLYRRARDRYPRIRDAFLIATALAFVVQWRYPVAPPRLVGLHDTVASLFHVSVGSVTDPLAAMPSLHVGWAVGVGVGVWSRSRIAAVTYAALVTLATLATGNHFVLDAVAGIAVMALAFAAAQVLERTHGATLLAATRGGAVR